MSINVGDKIVVYKKDKSILLMKFISADSTQVTGEVSVIDGSKVPSQTMTVQFTNINKIRLPSRAERKPIDIFPSAEELWPCIFTFGMACE